jgi:hypothetical protein
MTRIRRWPHEAGIYFPLLFFIVFEVWCFAGNHTILIALLLCGMAGTFCWIWFQHTKVISGFGFPLFAMLIFGPTFFYIFGKAADFYFYGMLFLVFPLIIAEYVQKTRTKYIPGTGSIAIMILGFIVSLIYQTIVHRGNYDYSLQADMMFMLALAVLFMIFTSLVLEFISIRQILLALTLSVLPLLIFSLYHCYVHGELAKVFVLRFGGTDALFNPDLVAHMLDFCFPFALFLALGEKKIPMKIFLLLLSLTYCICLFLTAARGALPGLAAIFLFFMIKSRSLVVWILVGALAICIFGAVGGRVANRILKPTRIDLASDIGRIELLKTAHALLKENHYSFGIGFNNFESEKYRFGFSRGFDAKRNLSSHNAYLELWLGWGILGLLGWLSLLIGSFIRLARTKLPVEMCHFKCALMFALFAFMVHNLFDSNIGYFTVMIWVVGTLSCMSFLSRLDIRNTAGVGTPLTKPDF